MAHNEPNVLASCRVNPWGGAYGIIFDSCYFLPSHLLGLPPNLARASGTSGRFAGGAVAQLDIDEYLRSLRPPEAAWGKLQLAARVAARAHGEAAA